MTLSTTAILAIIVECWRFTTPTAVTTVRQHVQCLASSSLVAACIDDRNFLQRESCRCSVSACLRTSKADVDAWHQTRKCAYAPPIGTKVETDRKTYGPWTGSTEDGGSEPSPPTRRSGSSVSSPAGSSSRKYILGMEKPWECMQQVEISLGFTT